ncbi:MAG: hypothetical protein GC137_05720 [Alphaproteobacteria bacterium]|nr:hypothetical protein [Alphaproteobacteria bacterium]
MKIKKSYISLLILLLLSTFGFYLYETTLKYTGDLAIKRMSKNERVILEKVDLIEQNMSFEDVISILGNPDRDGGGFRPTWVVNDNKLNQIAVYIGTEGVWKVRWMKVGSFIYEEKFLEH